MVKFLSVWRMKVNPIETLVDRAALLARFYLSEYLYVQSSNPNLESRTSI